MSIFEKIPEHPASVVVRRHASYVSMTKQYFDLLLENLNEQVRNYEKEVVRQLELGILDPETLPVRVSERGVKEALGPRLTCYRYVSTLTTVRLYPNQPPGWILGEVTYSHPFARQALRFARSFVVDGEGKDDRIVHGFFPAIRSTHVDDFASAIFNLLTLPSVVEIDLRALLN